jgi:hemerythrin
MHMMERIRELAEQAGWDNHHSKFDTRIEKFAELIIQECAKVSENRFRRMIRTLGSDMTKHFGVEE